MNFSMLDIFLYISGTVLLYFGLCVMRREGFRLMHFLLFIIGGGSVIVFTIFPQFLTIFGGFFGLQRGADLLVYIAIVTLLFLVIFLMQKGEKTAIKITKIIREMSLDRMENSSPLENDTILVIAAYNEERVIEKNLKNIFENISVGVVLVDDGSTDRTPEIVKNVSKKYPNLRLVRHLQNMGQGAALETGFECIRRQSMQPKYIVTFDADGQHRTSDVEKMQQFLDKNSHIDVVLGSRFIEQTHNNLPWFRKVILKGGIIFTGIISGIWLTDAHNGLRMIRYNALKKIIITINGMGHASEIVDIIASKKIPFAEMATHIDYTDYSLSKGQSSLNSIKIAMRMLFKKIF